ncbi:MAG: SGNH/GDSL hydrolase family protein [Bacteroidales bacterium]
MINFLKKILPLSLFCIVIFEGSAQVINILPLGNSITQSNNMNVSYRYPLWTKLIDDNYTFDFVGNQNSNNGGNPTWPNYNGYTFDQDHEGHWGWRCDEILAQLPVWLGSYTPDIVLLHLGTNDLYQGDGSPLNISTTINELKSIITALRNDNPNIIILLAKLIPSTNELLVDKIPLLNADIPQIAIDMDDPDSPIVIVDQFDGFDGSTDTFDGVHPNTAGEEKMAQKWREAINLAIGLPEGYRVNLEVFLEGPFNGVDMNTNLQSEMPLMQPFNTAPWNYPGTESVSEIPANIVDWVLVEIRDTTDVDFADPSTRIDRKACLLTNTGQIVDINGNMELEFNSIIKNGIFAVIFHRNHLGIISANQLSETSGVYFYNFAGGSTSARGGLLAQTDLGGGIFGMISGDYNADGEVNIDDIDNIWKENAGKSAYNNADGNHNMNIDNTDKNERWFVNGGKSTFIPE